MGEIKTVNIEKELHKRLKMVAGLINIRIKTYVETAIKKQVKLDLVELKKSKEIKNLLNN